jgi:ribosome biogenesis protein Nip4
MQASSVINAYRFSVAMNYEQFCKLFGSFVPKAHQVGERYYLVNEELATFKSGEQRKPHSMGLYLGMGFRQFTPTPALLTLLAQHSNRKAFTTDEKGEWLFLCGRDIFPELYKTEVTEGYVLVQNQHNENIGLAQLVPDKKGLLLKNVLDRGNYLRHEKITV